MRTLITGGTGFLGQHLASALLNDPADPRKANAVVVFSRDEHKQALMRERFSEEAQSGRLKFFLGDVRDPGRLWYALRGVDHVIHAAALKRVESCAFNPTEAVETNITGTLNVVRGCIEARVSKAVLVSSDKAAAPFNLYGKTKAVAESVWLSANSSYAVGADTRFSAVRYGNVAGSTGSVIPKWRALLKAGKKLDLYGQYATRFWLTIEQAVELVLNALTWENSGGKLYVPILDAFRLEDLAIVMDRGYRLFPPRLEDKLHEMLFTAEEAAFITPLGPVSASMELEGYSSQKPQHMLEREELISRLRSVR